MQVVPLKNVIAYSHSTRSMSLMFRVASPSLSTSMVILLCVLGKLKIGGGSRVEITEEMKNGGI